MIKLVTLALLALFVTACGSSEERKTEPSTGPGTPGEQPEPVRPAAEASNSDQAASGSSRSDEDRTEFFVRQNAAMMSELAATVERHKDDCAGMARALKPIIESQWPKRVAARKFAADNQDTRTPDELMRKTHKAVKELSAASSTIAQLLVPCADDPAMRALLPSLDAR